MTREHSQIQIYKLRAWVLWLVTLQIKGELFKEMKLLTFGLFLATWNRRVINIFIFLSPVSFRELIHKSEIFFSASMRYGTIRLCFSWE